MSSDGRAGEGEAGKGEGVQSSTHVATTKCVPYLEDGRGRVGKHSSEATQEGKREGGGRGMR